MKTPTHAIRNRARWLGPALVSVAIAVPAASAGVYRSQALAGRMHAYPYEAPYSAAHRATAQVNRLALARRFSEPLPAGARSVAAQVDPLAGRLDIYPYEAPFFPKAAGQASTFVNTLAAGRCPCNKDLPLSANPGGDSVAAAAAGHGFNWGDAGIGAASTAVLALLLIAGTQLLRHGDRTITKRRRLARSLERAAVPERPFIG